MHSSSQPKKFIVLLNFQPWVITHTYLHSMAIRSLVQLKIPSKRISIEKATVVYVYNGEHNTGDDIKVSETLEKKSSPEGLFYLIFHL